MISKIDRCHGTGGSLKIISNMGTTEGYRTSNTFDTDSAYASTITDTFKGV